MGKNVKLQEKPQKYYEKYSRMKQKSCMKRISIKYGIPSYIFRHIYVGKKKTEKMGKNSCISKLFLYLNKFSVFLFILFYFILFYLVKIEKKTHVEKLLFWKSKRKISFLFSLLESFLCSCCAEENT